MSYCFGRQAICYFKFKVILLVFGGGVNPQLYQLIRIHHPLPAISSNCQQVRYRFAGGQDVGRKAHRGATLTKAVNVCESLIGVA